MMLGPAFPESFHHHIILSSGYPYALHMWNGTSRAGRIGSFIFIQGISIRELNPKNPLAGAIISCDRRQ